MTPLPHGLPVIAGAGIAGLIAALTMRRPCLLLSPGPLGQGAASTLAQGGMAAVISASDSIERHVQDTLTAGDGLCDAQAVRRIIAQGPEVVEALLSLGVPFDRTPAGALDLHLEAAHSAARIVHARGDGSGAAIIETLIGQIRRASHIQILENASLRRVMTSEGAVSGVVVQLDGHLIPLQTSACVIASGGVGALYGTTTSPAETRGHGLAIAARAGARLTDMEFVQFHPTALDVPIAGRAPLVSEAVRGSGAILIDETGERFTDELAPRDQVARAIARHYEDGHSVFLDARDALGAAFPTHFPAITRACLAAGIDPMTAPIPVRPAVHYHMGGIATDRNGYTSLPGLWACGEAACTGLHGANRLASNSLLEAFVTGRSVGRNLGGQLLPMPGANRLTSVPYTGDHRSVLTRAAGILRNAAMLEQGLSTLMPHAPHDDDALVGAMICQAALNRRESRGAHYRTDFAHKAETIARSAYTLSDLLPDLPSPTPCEPEFL